MVENMVRLSSEAGIRYFLGGGQNAFIQSLSGSVAFSTIHHIKVSLIRTHAHRQILSHILPTPIGACVQPLMAIN